jgi:murein DD-endopeptidase MepM/ murein hydrolase activator NlpD
MPVLVPLLLATTWVWPLTPPHVVTRAFQPPATAYGAGHRGVDLVGAVGDPVHAAGTGVVSVAEVLAGRGVVVVVHGGLRTTYEPVTASVQPGASVAAGEVIGHLEAGHAGCSVAACLHWGLRRGETYLDPLTLVGRGRVRLLPLGEPPQGREPTATRATAQGASPARPTRRPTTHTSTVLAESAAAITAGAWILRRRRSTNRRH